MKTLYREAFIDAKGRDTVTVDGITFTSRMLRTNLDPVERAFPFVATCGYELDAADLPAGDFLAEFWWDATEVDFRSCQVCRREACPSRSAAFDPDLWDLQQRR